jgi:hypothetical protein
MKSVRRTSASTRESFRPGYQVFPPSRLNTVLLRVDCSCIRQGEHFTFFGFIGPVRTASGKFAEPFLSRPDPVLRPHHVPRQAIAVDEEVRPKHRSERYNARMKE